VLHGHVLDLAQVLPRVAHGRQHISPPVPTSSAEGRLIGSGG
jgi:hypothetical protein